MSGRAANTSVLLRAGASAIALITAATLSGCTARTLIHPLPEADESASPSRIRIEGCNVRDFATAGELPSGARNLGWVTVDAQETKDETFLLLRQRICELGGNALSQAAWIRESGGATGGGERTGSGADGTGTDGADGTESDAAEGGSDSGGTPRGPTVRLTANAWAMP